MAFDGGALSDIGLKDGSLVVQNEATGRQIKFDNMSIRLGRTADGGAAFTFTSQQPHGLATLWPPSARRATGSGASTST